jgi:hypothetical protein
MGEDAVKQIIIEVECRPGADQASTIMYAPADDMHKSIFEIPYRAIGLCAAGPAVLGSIGKFQDVLRAKCIGENDDALSAADRDILRRNGGHALSIRDCEILCAAARIMHGPAADEVAKAILRAGTIAMPAGDWLPAAQAKALLKTAGSDFMALHSRFAFGAMPKWASDWISREYTTMTAYS